MHLFTESYLLIELLSIDVLTKLLNNAYVQHLLESNDGHGSANSSGAFVCSETRWTFKKMEALLRANESMIEATSKVKKQKVQHAGVGHMECIATRLWELQKDLRKNYDDTGLSTIEVEVVI